MDPFFLNHFEELVVVAVINMNPDNYRTDAGRNITQTILLLDGEPNTGKTTLAQIIRNMAGSENAYQSRTSLLNEGFEIGRYRSKTLLFACDVEAGLKGYPPIPGCVFSMTYEKRVTKNRVYAPSCCPFSLQN